MSDTVITSASAGKAWRADLSRLARLALPMALSQAGYTLLGLINTAAAGRVGGETVAAVGLGAGLFYAAVVVGLGTALGVDPLASQAFGADDPRHARRVMWHGVYLTLLATLPLTLLLFGAVELVEAYGIEPSLVGEARRYVLGRAIAMAPFLVNAALRGYLQAAHRPAPALWAIALAVAVDVPASFFFVLGDRALTEVGLPGVGFAGWGAFGAGLAGSVAGAVQLVVLWPAVAALRPARGEAPVHRFSPVLMKQLVSIGLPVGLQMLAEVGVFVLAGVVMASLGTLPMAAHQVALMVASVTFSVCVGIGGASSVQVGRAIGRGDAEGARRSGLLGMGVGVAFMACSALVMWLTPEAVARLLTSDPEVLPLAASLLRIGAVFQIVDGVQAVATGALRGTGMTRPAFIANVVAHWAVGLPLALFFAFGLSWGPQGLWWGLTAGLAVVAFFLVALFERASRGELEALARDT